MIGKVVETTPEGVVFLFVHKNGMFTEREHEKDVNSIYVSEPNGLWCTVIKISRRRLLYGMSQTEFSCSSVLLSR